MKPETPLGALAAAIHLDTYDSHPTPCSCLWWRQDVDQAQRLLEGLTELGWLPPAPMVSLPESVPAGEPATAASEIENLTDRQWAVWFVLSHFGPQADEELVDRYAAGVFGSAGNILPPQTPQSIRSRRAELVRAGHVAKTGERRPTSNGGTAAVWVARTDALRLAEAS